MKTLKRWIKNIRWLFNHPPVGVTTQIVRKSCEFCGSYETMAWGDEITICFSCTAKAFRKVLAPTKKRAEKKYVK